MTEYLNKINELKEYPRNFGVINYKGEEEDLNLRSFYMGNRFSQAFSQGLKKNYHVKHLNISRNNLEDTGFQKILEGISYQVESINMSDNVKITAPSYQKLALLLEDPEKELKSITIEGN